MPTLHTYPAPPSLDAPERIGLGQNRKTNVRSRSAPLASPFRLRLPCTCQEPDRAWPALPPQEPTPQPRLLTTFSVLTNLRPVPEASREAGAACSSPPPYTLRRAPSLPPATPASCARFLFPRKDSVWHLLKIDSRRGGLRSPSMHRGATGLESTLAYPTPERPSQPSQRDVDRCWSAQARPGQANQAEST